MSGNEQRDSIRSCYATWSETYFDDYLGNAADYWPVHVELIDQILTANNAGTILDVGCGPASMTRLLANKDREFYGFDLTPEMIMEARKVGTEYNIPSERFWVGDSVDPNSYWPDISSRPKYYDAIICSGVLPHLEPEEVDTVLMNLRNAVKMGGLVIVEARNELFSLFTLNRYSRDFFFDQLIDLNSLPTDVAAKLKKLDEHFRTDLPPLRIGTDKSKGYDEVTSNTHNPLTLKPQFASIGFQNISLDFFHFHRLPPMFESELPDTFRDLGKAMEDPQDWRGYFMASAFLLSGMRK
jgi:SAM-dependent methyltransferase